LSVSKAIDSKHSHSQMPTYTYCTPILTLPAQNDTKRYNTRQ